MFHLIFLLKLLFAIFFKFCMINWTWIYIFVFFVIVSREKLDGGCSSTVRKHSYRKGNMYKLLNFSLLATNAAHLKLSNNQTISTDHSEY